MQKGKMSRGGLVGTARAIAVLCLIINAAPCSGALAADSWKRGMGGVSFPSRAHPAAVAGKGEYLLVMLSAENPYSIPGLYRSSVFFSNVRKSWSCGIEWERTALNGYSQDVFGASAGFAAPRRFIHLRLIAEAERETVAGYGGETVLQLRLGVLFDLAGMITIELENAALSSRSEQLTPGCCRIFIRAEDGSLYAGLTVRDYSGSGRMMKAGGSVRVSGPLSLLAGYGFDTGEVTGGLAVEAAAAVTLSWGCHPALGSTFSVSIGAVR